MSLMKEEIKVGDTPLIVEFYYSPACKGEREKGTGLQLTPDEDEEIIIYSIRVFEGGLNLLNLLEDEDIQATIDALIKHVENEKQIRLELAAERKGGY